MMVFERDTSAGVCPDATRVSREDWRPALEDDGDGDEVVDALVLDADVLCCDMEVCDDDWLLLIGA